VEIMAKLSGNLQGPERADEVKITTIEINHLAEVGRTT
jgi:hypothetical protein